MPAEGLCTRLSTRLLAAVVLLAALAVGTGPAAAGGPVSQRAQPPRKVFDDEFNGSQLNQRKWYPNRWFAATCSKGATAGELQYYTDRPTNVSVSNGHLHITARKESYACPEGPWAGTSGYTSGWIQTGGARPFEGTKVNPAFTIGTGYVEARVKLPRGKGLWSSIWLMRTYIDAAGQRRYPSRPEIDALEVLGNTSDVWRFNLHLRNVDWGVHYHGPDTAAGWHRIGVWRRPHRIVWFADGRRVLTYAGRSIPGPHVRTYLILNLIAGGDWPGQPDDQTRFPATMLVDWVRAWAPRPPFLR